MLRILMSLLFVVATGCADSGRDSDSDDTGSACDSLEPTDDEDRDGLTNGEECSAGTNPLAVDSDGDGVQDLAEQVAGSDPLDSLSHPFANGDLYFEMPYLGESIPDKGIADYKTERRKADIFLMVDTTASMHYALNDLHELLMGPLQQADEMIPDVRFGLARFDDLTDPNYSNPQGDVTFEILTPFTTDLEQIRAELIEQYSHDGGDNAEGHLAALYAMATGDGIGNFLSPVSKETCQFDQLGYPCFDSDAKPVVLLFTDGTLHNFPNYETPHDLDDVISPYNTLPLALQHVIPTYEETVEALKAMGAKVIGVVAEPPLAALQNNPELSQEYEVLEEQLGHLATDTNAVDMYGEPHVFRTRTNFTGFVDAIGEVAQNTPKLTLSVEVKGDPSDSVDSSSFVDHILAAYWGGKLDPARPDLVCASQLDVVDLSGDGHDDAFSEVLPHLPVCFQLNTASNTLVPPGETSQVFTATVDIISDSETVVATKTIYFLVPIHGGAE